MLNKDFKETKSKDSVYYYAENLDISNGEVKFYYKSGKIHSISNYINDIQEGEYIEYYENDSIAEKSTYRNDKLHGYQRLYYENGNKEQICYYLDGIKEKIDSSFFESGKLESISIYNKGKLNGEITYFENGNINEFVSYRDNILDGECRVYYENGSILGLCTYENNKLEGKLIEYYPNGIKKLVAEYHNNDLKLEPIEYDSLGNLNNCKNIQATLKSNIKKCVLFLNGYATNKEDWDKTFLNRIPIKGYIKWNIDKNQIISENIIEFENNDTYLFEYGNSLSPIDRNSSNLNECINELNKIYDEIVLVGFSMGGLVARHYLTINKCDNKVSKLITISTPHLGTSLVSNLKIVDLISFGVLGKVAKLFSDYDLSKQATDDLEPNSDFLINLNTRSIPNKTKYVSIITQNYSKPNTDGVVEIYSQKMSNIPFFKFLIKNNYQLDYIEYFVNSSHKDAMKNSDILNFLKREIGY